MSVAAEGIAFLGSCANNLYYRYRIQGTHVQITLYKYYIDKIAKNFTPHSIVQSVAIRSVKSLISMLLNMDSWSCCEVNVVSFVYCKLQICIDQKLLIVSHIFAYVNSNILKSQRIFYQM